MLRPLEKALNKLAKWRSVFAGWQLGTRMNDDAECHAVRDHREVTMMLRAEVSALTTLLLRKAICSPREFENQLQTAAEELDRQYELKFPGISTSEEGVHYNVDMVTKMGTMRNWKP